MDAEFADLVPLFVEEARDRLERLVGALPRLEQRGQGAEALAEVKRELHTLKGAGRMLQLAAFSSLCHAAEEMLANTPSLGAARPRLVRVADALAGMVDQVAAGQEPSVDAELEAWLNAVDDNHDGRGGSRTAADSEKGGSRTAPTLPVASMPPVSGTTSQTPPAGSTPPTPPSPPPEPPVPSAPVRLGAEFRIDAASLDGLAERATQIRILALSGRSSIERIAELARLAEGGIREPQPAQVLAVLSAMLRRLALDLEGTDRRLVRTADEQIERVLALQLQPLGVPLSALARAARDLGRSLGREVEVVVTGGETRLDRRIIRDLDEALLHLLRNAVDHGLESVSERLAAGKPAAGQIRLEARALGSRVALSIADDGRGIDPRAVAQRAVALGLLEAAAAERLDAEAAHRLLFTAGFTTREEASDLSGRGIGLDVVAAAVARVGGEITITSELGRGTFVALELPIARRGAAVMIVRLGQVKLAIPAGLARRIVRLPTGAILEREGRSFAHLGGRLVPFLSLARRFGQPEAERPFLIEGSSAGRAVAITVDEILGEEEVLVRPLARAAGADDAIEGVALLASGEPVGVLSPAVLVDRRMATAVASRPSVAPLRRVRVLLVDDSLVTREMERRLLEDAGFDVMAVADAADALSRLGEEHFDCVVTDIEMPGMDGFELTRQLRCLERLAGLPIIVVSTRDRPEDRLLGLRSGADAYLTKQSLDAGELVDLVRRLGGR